MLADLANKIRSEELNTMKFICGDKIPKSVQEDIKSPVDLWDALEERDLLRSDYLDFLFHLLERGTNNRTDVLNVLAVYDKGGGPCVPVYSHLPTSGILIL